LAAGGEGAFQFAFHAEMLGKSHGAGAVGLVADTLNSAEDEGPVNWVGAIEDAGDEAVEKAAGDMGEEVVVPDGVVEEAADGFGFEGAEDEDAFWGAADGVEGDSGELDVSSSRKEPGMSWSWSNWMRAETSAGRCWGRRAAALAGSEKPSLKSLSYGWWRSSSGIGLRGG